uniref:Uncharacterized protein n=1 Tax=Cannabis sativa TaxID=3483 RepID=A0A803Q361_CANSA
MASKVDGMIRDFSWGGDKDYGSCLFPSPFATVTLAWSTPRKDWIKINCDIKVGTGTMCVVALVKDFLGKVLWIATDILEFTDPLIGSWDHDLVRDMFNFRDASLILDLPLSITDEDDCWSWTGETNSSFTVSNAYMLLQQNKEPQPAANNFGFWKNLWQL